MKRERKRKKKLLHIIFFTSLILIAVAVVIGLIWYRSLELQYPRKYEEDVTKYAAEFEIDPHLVYSMIREESSFRPKVVSGSGAIGLMQIMPATGEEVAGMLGMEGFMDEALNQPDINIRIGCKYFAQLLEEYDNDYVCAIAAYNCGPNKVNGWLKLPEYSPDGKTLEKIPYKETREHVKKVLNSYEMYNKIYGKNP